MSKYNGPVCVRCGETESLLLQLDHIDGGGNQHAIQIAGEGNWEKGRAIMYKHLEDNGWPPIMQVLCCNCNVKAARAVERLTYDL